MLTVQAPAKINLTFEVSGKRPDGYHEIRSVIQTIDLCDELRFETALNTGYSADLPSWDGEKSLVGKTVQLLGKISGSDQGVAITIKKRIPLVSGLGGDSSDAAATLIGLNSLWSLDLSATQLHGLAAQLGSDVPFFLSGGTALMEGRGEKITTLPALNRTWLVLLIPDVPRLPRKTEQLYDNLKPNHYTDGSITSRLAEEIKQRKDIDTALLCNTFENIAFDISSELAVYRRHILQIGAPNLHLAGSGPAMFAVVKSKAEGQDLCLRLKTQGLKIYLTYTLNSKTGVL